jgi:hypothetical protein
MPQAQTRRCPPLKMVAHKNGYWLGLIVLLALALRLYPHIDFSSDGIRLVGTCGPLFDVVKPLFESGNLLNFEVFFYPPVAPLIIAGTAKIISAIIPGIFDLGLHCLFITIVFSSVTIVVLYYIGREWSPAVGLLAAAFYGVTMIAVDSAINVQVYSAFFTLLAIYFFYKYQHQPKSANLILMGTFLGLAIGSKYFPIVLVPMFLLLHLFIGRTAVAKSLGAASVQPSENSTVNIQSFLLHTSLSILVFACLGMLYVGVFNQGSLLTLLKGIYDTNSHEHPFEYHLNSIQRILNLGLWGVGAIGICAASGILIPKIKGRDAWEWAREYFHRHRIWILPSISMIITILIAIGIPAISNLNRYAAYTVWMANAYASSDGGMFPAGRPAPSYFLSFFPESLGIPLFVAGCAGLAYCLLTRDRKTIMLLLIVLPLYLMLERSSVKVNRYALELMPMFCLFAAMGLEHLRRAKSSMTWQVVGIALSITILCYSTLYALAWANVTRPDRDVRVEATEWIKSHVSEGSRIGMNGQLWVVNSPQLIPDPSMLRGYRIENYTSLPEYVVMPKLLFEVVCQYDRLTRAGYAYRQEDWTPQSPPRQEELDALINIVNQQQYVLVKEFEKVPSFSGISFDNQRFGGRTWLREHAAAYGIQIYQKRRMAS